MTEKLIRKCYDNVNKICYITFMKGTSVFQRTIRKIRGCWIRVGNDRLIS